jgi:hypothetical protein
MENIFIACFYRIEITSYTIKTAPIWMRMTR